MKYYLLAGEASGDLHGSNLMKALLKVDPKADFRFWGGDLMQDVGGTLVLHYKERSFMGFLEVILNLGRILGLIKKCKKDIEAYQPDVMIFIDNSGFNLRIAKWAKEMGFKTNYYISPQVWASRAGRVEKIKRDIDKMFVILPFEKDFYQTFNYEVSFVGHPLIDAISQFQTESELEFKKKYQLDKRPIIALLPGSRKQEITKMLGVMLSMVDQFKDFQFVIAGAPSQSYDFYKSIIKKKDVGFVDNETYALLKLSHAALVTSGTATLETALFKVPQVVCYKANAISYYIAKKIITLDFISLVNLIMDREIVTELIQHDFNTKRLKMELEAILSSNKRKEMLTNYDILIERLGGAGASNKAAQQIVAQFNMSNA
ncbi:MAG: lipid-A-disaccharide synthase [Bacteroidota bacterium]